MSGNTRSRGRTGRAPTTFGRSPRANLETLLGRPLAFMTRDAPAMTAAQGDQGHAAFIKRNGSMIAELLTHAFDDPQRGRLSLIEELTVVIATDEVHAVLDGRHRRTFDRIFASSTPVQRAKWTPDDWTEALRGAKCIVRGAAGRLHRLHKLLSTRHDFPHLPAMRKWGIHKWEALTERIGCDRAIAASITSLILDRVELPGGPSTRRMYTRLGFPLGEHGRPRRLSLDREDLLVSKWRIQRLAHEVCAPVATPGKEACAPCPIKAFCAGYRDATRPRRQKGPTFVDLFAGGGGLSLGLTNAGLHLRLAVEVERHAADTLYLNHPEAPNGIVDARDIRKLLKDKKKLAQLAGVDVIAGGPPCQPFSMARRHSKADRNDPRRFLFRSYVRMVKRLRPRIVIVENVPGIRNAAGGDIVEAIQKEFDAIGYDMDHQLLNAADYGVPQNRQRIFFIGVRRRDFRQPKEALRGIFERIRASKVARPIKAKDALSGIPRLKAGQGAQVVAKTSRGPLTGYGREMHDKGSDLLFNHETRGHNPRDIAIFRSLRPGETAEELEARKPNTIPYQLESFSDKYRKIHPARPAPTIPAHLHRDANSFVHFEVARGITGREAARFQSFPDDYVFLGGFGPAFIQIGNAVPPKLAQVVGEAVKQALGAARRRKQPAAPSRPGPPRPRAPTARPRPSPPLRARPARGRPAPGSRQSWRARRGRGSSARRNARGTRARSTRARTRRRRPP